METHNITLEKLIKFNDVLDEIALAYPLTTGMSFLGAQDYLMEQYKAQLCQNLE